MDYEFIGTFGKPALFLEDDEGRGRTQVYIPWAEIVRMMNFLADERYVNIDSYPQLKSEVNQLRHKLNKNFEYYDRIAEMEKHLKPGGRQNEYSF